jgi:hypothetical protein
MAKSKVLIPHQKQDQSVPHWVSPYNLEQRLADYKAALAAGYETKNKHYGYYSSEDSWRQHLLALIKENDLEWKEPYEFFDTMQIVGSYRGRSAAGFELKSITTGGTHCMMLGDMEEMIPNATITKGVVMGRWKHKKRGQNYSLFYLGEV